ncbi:MAG TPA: hypothetical protein VGS28_00235 [Candidatus Saccharimonadales bacterium]|nr:hypothetical protein [Candidatus Saccharimonadales bacterium]
MAIALVNQAGVSGGFQSSPQVISYTSTAGNTLIFSGFLYYSTASVPAVGTISDSAGNTWNYSTSNSQYPPFAGESANGGGCTVFIAWSLSAKPITSLTLTTTNGSPWTRVVISEWTGIAAFDSSASAFSTVNQISGSVTTNLSMSGDLIVGAFETTVGSTSFSQPTGWTDFTASGAVNNNSYDLPGVVGPYTATITMNQASDWAFVVAAFKPDNPSAMIGFFP